MRSLSEISARLGPGGGRHHARSSGDVHGASAGVQDGGRSQFQRGKGWLGESHSCGLLAAPAGAPVAARADDVEHVIAGVHCDGVIAHRLGEAGDLAGGLTL